MSIFVQEPGPALLIFPWNMLDRDTSGRGRRNRSEERAPDPEN